ncbi:GNAT family N-acetyltransferase [Microtetraspora sp. NBRC 16547]|uniref:GNAT family N-acetyltransferase n=1 Tax=Microtetraspora sp. NBRC 16547 TaxID=3030993 RepID=UPI0024A136FA|nr:GNAT family N-acetyltransferase [Microtetraspora sp. NBRC 16547]GLX02482.1 putative succinyl-CoA transferase [Microtetraspora sp. NBRC 16547]
MRHWPLLDLRLTTPRLELRLPTLDDLDELADCALQGVHDPGFMPFLVPWTDVPGDELSGQVIRHHLACLANWTPGSWRCNFMVVHEGKVIGTQTLRGTDFATTREVGSGSWLGRAHQGKGIGTEMRATVLHLAFAGLGAESAITAALTGNEASLTVTRKLGYQPNGFDYVAVRGERVADQKFRLLREDFVSPVPVEIHGLDACRTDFGL